MLRLARMNTEHSETNLTTVDTVIHRREYARTYVSLLPAEKNEHEILAVATPHHYNETKSFY